jgi:parvulin-like peptidyl-prolyl isomerase
MMRNIVMSDIIKVSCDEIVEQVKFSGQMPAILEGIVARKAIVEAAKEANIQVTVEELQQAADKLRLAKRLHRAQDAQRWFQEQGLSLDEFERMIHAQVLADKLAQHLFADEVEPYFVKHGFNHAQVVMYEIVLEDEDLAMDLFYSIQEGELDFHAVAHQYIQNQDLRRAGGYRGLLRREDLKPEISAAVFAANPPIMIRPVLTPKGVHLIWVQEIIQPELNAATRDKLLAKMLSDWLMKQCQKAGLKSTD